MQISAVREIRSRMDSAVIDCAIPLTTSHRIFMSKKPSRCRKTSRECSPRYECKIDF